MVFHRVFLFAPFVRGTQFDPLPPPWQVLSAPPITAAPTWKTALIEAVSPRGYLANPGGCRRPSPYESIRLACGAMDQIEVSHVRTQFPPLIHQGLVVLIGQVRQEILSGIKHEGQFIRLRDMLRAFPDLPLTDGVQERAEEWCNKCVSRGYGDFQGLRSIYKGSGLREDDPGGGGSAARNQRTKRWGTTGIIAPLVRSKTRRGSFAAAKWPGHQQPAGFLGVRDQDD